MLGFQEVNISNGVVRAKYQALLETPKLSRNIIRSYGVKWRK